MGEMIFNTALFLFGLFLIYLFFTKKRLFPKAYIAISLAAIAFILLDAGVAKLVIPAVPMFDTETVTNLVRASVAAAIWIPYMLVSKRVKATFIEPMSARTEAVSPNDQ